LSVFPELPELLIYENKRYLSYWLKANSVPSPKTWVFYHHQEANAFIQNVSFPIVAKLNVGASGSGVTILQNKLQAEKYCNKIFNRGIRPRIGPRLSRGNMLKRILNKIKSPVLLKDKLIRYRAVAGNKQKGFVLFQEFIPHDFEWRAVRIGNSFFAHKKLLKHHMASGSLIKNYDNPPLNLLDFIKDLTDRHNFRSQAIDVFETAEGKYLVNEMQCIFGQSDPYQMLVNGKPGRYLNNQNGWVFEQGDFNSNESYDLRMQFVIEMLHKKNEI
jgi:glutathione synthase/RimK-type ligase-like ATP-grasp enzyme